MKRFKFLSFILILVVSLGLVLTGCNGNSDNGNNNPPSEPNGVYYTVDFDSQGGSSVESQKVLEGNPVKTPATPTRENYSFLGWYKSTDENADEWKFATDRVNSDITLYAKWQSSESYVPTESLTFERKGEGYVVTGASGQEERVIIPAEHDGLPVIEIGESAFSYGKHTSDIT